MSSVLRTYASLPLARHRFRFVTTYHPDYLLWSFGPFLRAFWLLCTRSQHDLGISHFHLSTRGSFVREGILVSLARHRGLPVCVTIHSGGFPGFLASFPRTVRTVLARADRILVLGKSIQDEIGNRTGITAVHVFPNAVLLPETFLPPSQCEHRVVFGGDVCIEKGVDVLLQAWPEVRQTVPDAELVIAGPCRGIRPRTLPGVEWPGPVPSRRLLQILAGSRVAVLPSRAEGMPMFVLEAMAQGRPVVATPVGTLPEILVDAGTIVPVGDSGRLAAALISYLMDCGFADRAGDAGRMRIKKDFGVHRTAQVLEHMYEGLVGNGESQGVALAEQSDCEADS